MNTKTMSWRVYSRRQGKRMGTFENKSLTAIIRETNIDPCYSKDFY